MMRMRNETALTRSSHTQSLRLERNRFQTTKEPIHVVMRLPSQRKNFNRVPIHSHAGHTISDSHHRSTEWPQRHRGLLSGISLYLCACLPRRRQVAFPRLARRRQGILCHLWCGFAWSSCCANAAGSVVGRAQTKF